MLGASQARIPSGPDPHPPLLVPRQAMCSPNYNLFFFNHLWKLLEGWIPVLTEHFFSTDLSKATLLPRQFCGLRNVSIAALQQRCQLTPTPTTQKEVVMTVVRKEQGTLSAG